MSRKECLIPTSSQTLDKSGHILVIILTELSSLLWYHYPTERSGANWQDWRFNGLWNFSFSLLILL